MYEPISVASLSLKGGGQEGVGAASPRYPSCCRRPASLRIRRTLCFGCGTPRGRPQFVGHRGRHRPPPLLPLSGGGILCDNVALYFRRTVFATTCSHMRLASPFRRGIASSICAG